MRPHHRPASAASCTPTHRATLALLAAVGLATPARATTFNFIPGVQSGSATPAGSGNWADAGSWAGTVNSQTTYAVPGPSDQASSSTGATTTIDSAVPTVNEVRFSNVAPGSNDYTVTGGGTPYASTGRSTLTIAPAGSLTIQSTDGTSNGSLTVGNANGATGTLNINGGTLSTGGATQTTEVLGGLESLVIGGTATSATVAGPTGNFFINAGAVTVANNFYNGYGATVVASSVGFATGNTTQSGGSITVAGAVVIGARGHGTYVMTAGSLTQAGTNGDAPTNSLGRDAFVLGQSDTSGASGNAQGGQGTFAQSGTAVVSIANGLYIANQSNTKGAYTISGGSLTIAGDLSVAAPLGSGVGNAAPVPATNNIGSFQVNGHAAATITANHLTANTANSTLGFAIGSFAGTSLISLSAGHGYDGSAQLSTSTLIDIDPLDGAPAPNVGVNFTLLTATRISALPTLVSDGDYFDKSQLYIRNNPDGTQSLIDAYPFIDTFYNPADANHDGKVDFNDFSILVNHYGTTGQTAGSSVGDFSLDGNVDFNDFTILVNNYDRGTEPAGLSPQAPSLSMVPEPATLSLLTLPLLGRRRRRA